MQRSHVVMCSLERTPDSEPIIVSSITIEIGTTSSSRSWSRPESSRVGVVRSRLELETNGVAGIGVERWPAGVAQSRSRPESTKDIFGWGKSVS